MVEQFTTVVDRIDAQERARRNLTPNAEMAKFRAIVSDDLLRELLGFPRTFPLTWDILGWNIQNYISHLLVCPPEISLVDNLVRGLHWYQNGARPVPEMERPQPRLSIKVSYLVSDVRGKNCGAMRIVLGSHKLDELPPADDAGFDPPGAIEIRVAPGTAVLFDRRLWHSRVWNYSNVRLNVLSIGYSYRWLRGLNCNAYQETLLSRCDLSPITQ